MMGIPKNKYSKLIRHLSPLIRKMDKITSLILSTHLECTSILSTHLGRGTNSLRADRLMNFTY